MTSLQRTAGVLKGRAVRGAALAVSRWRPARPPGAYRPGTTLVVVTWNSLPYLRLTIAAVRATTPPGTDILVVDNASRDGTREWLASQPGIRTMHLPINVGHGVALDLAVPRVDTEFLAVLDVDAFPVSTLWLDRSIAALDSGAQVAGAHLHRNFVHPCFLVTRTPVLHQYRLTFRPVGSLATHATQAPLFLDVAEALSQRLVVKFGGGQALHFFEITQLDGPGKAGAVFGDLVYHNMYATQGAHQAEALAKFERAVARHHPSLAGGDQGLQPTIGPG